MDSSSLSLINTIEFKRLVDTLKEEFSFEFSLEDFDGAWIKNLPDADLINENKTKKSGHTSHIAVTASSMELFPIKRNKLDSTWRRLEITMVSDPIALKSDKFSFVSSFFSRREAYDKNNKHQVYISSKEYDDKIFYNLRKKLFIGDQIWFLKFHGESRYLVFAIKEELSRKLKVYGRYFFRAENKNTVSKKETYVNFRNNVLLKIKASKSLKKLELNQMLLIDYNYSIIKNWLERAIDELLIGNYINYDKVLNEEYLVFRDNNLEEYASEIIDNQTNVTGDDKSNEIEIVDKFQQSKRFKTNKEIRNKALEKANFLCEYAKIKNETHKTFLTNNNRNYVEAHHLVRMCDQKDSLFVRNGKYISLDQVQNIVSLCPNCHAKIHLGREQEIKIMLTELYETRKSLLEEGKIFISLEQLVGFYTK